MIGRFHLQHALVRAVRLHHLERAAHESGPEAEFSESLIHHEHADVAAVAVAVLVELAYDDTDALTAEVGENAQLGPVIDEVAVGEDEYGSLSSLSTSVMMASICLSSSSYWEKVTSARSGCGAEEAAAPASRSAVIDMRANGVFRCARAPWNGGGAGAS